MLEGAAALALLFAPDKIREYLKEIGVEPAKADEAEEVKTVFNIHDLRGFK